MSKHDKKVSNAAIQKARALHKGGLHGQAEDIYRMILLSDPDNAAALLDLGLSLAQRGETVEPIALYTRVLELDPHNSGAMVALTIATMESGDMDEAVRLAHEARKTKLTPQSLSVLGSFYIKAGLRENATECLDAAIARAPHEVAPYFTLYRLKKIKPDSAEFRKLLEIEKHAASLRVVERAALHFILADTYLGADDPASAFRHYAEANRLKRGTVYFAAEPFVKNVDAVIDYFTPELVKKLSGGGNPSERPVFIVGMPRSGSTLVSQIIASHPGAKSMGEVKCLQESIPDNFQRAPQTLNLTPQGLDDIAARYLKVTEKYAQGAKRLSDKMLPNFLWIGIIRLALPNAKIIHCTRHPADIALSIWQLLFSEGLVPWAYDAKEIGIYYKAYRKLMAHWQKLFPGDIYEAPYEAMVQDQEGESKKLIAACGLPWDDHCLKFYETARFVKTASAEQVRRPIYKDSVAKWKKYEAYIAPLIEAVKE